MKAPLLDAELGPPNPALHGHSHHHHHTAPPSRYWQPPGLVRSAVNAALFLTTNTLTFGVVEVRTATLLAQLP